MSDGIEKGDNLEQDTPIQNNEVVEKQEQPIIQENKTKETPTKESKKNNKVFENKAGVQMDKLLKEFNNLEVIGKKSELTEDEVNALIIELKDQTNICKKLYLSNLDKKEDNFGDLSNPMVRAIREIRNLSELSHRHAGEYDEEHIEKIFSRIKKEIANLKKSFNETENDENKFSF